MEADLWKCLAVAVLVITSAGSNSVSSIDIGNRNLQVATESIHFPFEFSPYNFVNSLSRNFSFLGGFGVNTPTCYKQWATKRDHISSEPRGSQEQGFNFFKSDEYAGKSSEIRKKLIVWQAFDTVSLTEGGSAMFEGCPVDQCTVSLLPNDIPSADAVVYDFWPIGRQNPPTGRKDNQIFIYCNMGPTAAIKYRYFYPAWRVAFNWTWSYRLDADIFQPFAFLSRTAPKYPFAYYESIVKEKSNLAVYGRASGRSQSHLEKFIDQMSTEAGVHVIDLTNTNLSSLRENDKATINNHFFYLAFEPALCEDFVTEAFMDVFDPDLHVVPAVRGGVDYQRFFPDGTFVDVSEMTTSQASKALARIAADKQLYTEMLWRKAHYVKRDGLSAAWCSLCEKLHSYRGNCHYDDMQTWWWGSGRCHAAKYF